MSGVVVNERAETEIPGLYVVGDTASVPKQHLTGAFVFGEVAAEQAVDFIASHPPAALDDGQVRDIEAQRDRRFTAAGRGIDVRSLEYKVRRLIGDYLVSPKNEYKLKRWQEWALRFHAEIEDQVAVSDGHELSKLYEVEHILRCASVSAQAALERKETRWGDAHRRTDFPDQDDENFHCHIVIHQGEDPMDLRTSKRSIVDLENEEVSR
jgi:succinate dehydrogenase/fumarate reductase flavoprotein subunit